jgi:hypothetical protein
MRKTRLANLDYRKEKEVSAPLAPSLLFILSSFYVHAYPSIILG